MFDITTDEFKRQIRDKFFTNSLVRSGIVQIVDEPLPAGACNQHRYQSWNFERFDSVNKAADRIGEYVSRRLGQAILCAIQGAVGSEQLPENELERGIYRLAQRNLCQQILKDTDHTIALIPSYLRQFLVTSYHLCPFTKQRIPSGSGKQLVVEDMCLQPYLFFPGEVQLFFRDIGETKLDPNDSNVFSHWWNYDVSIKGFDWIGPNNSTNYNLDDRQCWNKTGASRIVWVR